MNALKTLRLLLIISSLLISGCSVKHSMTVELTKAAEGIYKVDVEGKGNTTLEVGGVKASTDTKSAPLFTLPKVEVEK